MGENSPRRELNNLFDDRARARAASIMSTNTRTDCFDRLGWIDQRFPNWFPARLNLSSRSATSVSRRTLAVAGEAAGHGDASSISRSNWISCREHQRSEGEVGALCADYRTTSRNSGGCATGTADTRCGSCCACRTRIGAPGPWPNVDETRIRSPRFDAKSAEFSHR